VGGLRLSEERSRRARRIRNNIFTNFHDFLIANNLETANDNPLRLWLLCGLIRGYEPAKSELSRFRKKIVLFGTYDPWGEGGQTGP
jgi:hypothetical protein